jgi:hypothetical protein
MAFHYSPKIVMEKLEFYLDAANPKSYVSGSTSWNDISRGGYVGNLTNGPTFNPINGGSIEFDAIDDFVNLTNQVPSYNSVVTAEAWINPSGNGGGSGNAATILYHSGRYLQYQNGRIHSYWDGGYYSTPINSILLNTWNNVVQSWDSPNGLLKVYINGVLSLEQVIGTGNKTSGTDAQIGMEGIYPGGAYARLFRGKIASIKLYRKVLSPSEILQNYNATKTRFGLT